LAVKDKISGLLPLTGGLLSPGVVLKNEDGAVTARPTTAKLSSPSRSQKMTRAEY
jgi:hypothetical protein